MTSTLYLPVYFEITLVLGIFDRLAILVKRSEVKFAIGNCYFKTQFADCHFVVFGNFEQLFRLEIVNGGHGSFIKGFSG